ncbi:MAG: flippase [Lachnospiraceae bacterium]|nr:flippase [Lachnospiraceae bacterium]
MSQSKVVKNYIYNTAYQILVLIAPLVTTPYVSRVLGPEGVGIYSYGQSIATYFVFIGIFGTTMYGQREIAYVHDDPVRRSQIFWEIVLIKSLAVALCTAVYIAVFAHGRQYSAVFQVLIVEVAATAFDITWFFMGLQNFKLTVIRNTIVKLIGIILVFVFVKKPEDVVIYTACMTLPTFIGNLSLWFSLPKYLVRVKLTKERLLSHIRPTFALFVPQLATEVYVLLDKTMLGALASNIDEVGFYSQASKIVKIVLLLVTSLGNVMMPAMAEAYAKGKEDVVVNSIRKAFRFVFMLGFALMFGLCGISKNFVPIFFGPGYDKVIILMIAISPILILIAMSNVMGRQYLVPTRQEKGYSMSVISGACVNFLLNLLLIRQFEAYGASIATVVAELTVTLIQAYWVHKKINMFECVGSGVRYLLIGLVMGVCVYLTGEALPGGIVTLCVQVLVGMAVYGGALLLLKDPLLMEGKQMLMNRKKR